MVARLIEAYRDRLPVTDATPVITLHEGNTPLVPAPALSSAPAATST
jgi:threonine synthase